MHDAPIISPDSKNSSRDIIDALPKVDLHVHVPANGNAAADVSTTLTALAADRVVYAELRFAPEQYEGRPAEVIQQALGALEHEGIDARLVITAIRQLGAAEELAGLAVECAARDPRVVGFDFAGEGPVDVITPACAVLRKAYLPFSVHAGAFEFEEIGQALQLGATRIGHATAILEDFSASIEGIEPGVVSRWIRDRGVLIESAPLLELQMEALEEIQDHPLPLLDELGFTVAACSGNLEAGSVGDVFETLHEEFTYGLEEFFALTVAALEHAYCSTDDRKLLLEKVIVPGYQPFADPEYAEDAADAEDAGLSASHEEHENKDEAEA